MAAWLLAILLAAAPCPLRAGGPGPRFADPRVTEVPDGGTLVLEDGRQVRLAGIEAPAGTAPFAPEARKALARLALGRSVIVESSSASPDRYGRIVADIHRDDGLWVQGALAEGGFARVHTRPDDRALAGPLLAAEARARAGHAGLWRLDAYRVRAASGPIAPTDAFHLVEGTVVAAERRRDAVYLNFGPDWRTDFTVTIPGRALRDLQKAGIDPLRWQGRLLRLRGWLYERNGPMIDLTHPEQVEFLD